MIECKEILMNSYDYIRILDDDSMDRVWNQINVTLIENRNHWLELLKICFSHELFSKKIYLLFF